MNISAFTKEPENSEFYEVIFQKNSENARKEETTMDTPDLKNAKKTDDTEMIRRFNERDESVLKDVSRKYGGYCSSIARNILGNEQAAEECVNDTLMRLWESIPPAKPSYFPAYVGKIVRNIAINSARHEAALKRGGGEIDAILDEAEEMISSGDNVEQTAQRHEIMAMVNEWLGTLPAKKRAVFVLRFWHCKGVSEIAQCVGMSAANIENVLKRERKKLVEFMSKRGF